MKNDWLEIFHLFSLTLSGFLIQASILVTFGFVLIILFGLMVSFIPQFPHPQFLWISLFGILLLAGIRILLWLLQKHFLFSIHSSYQAALASLLYRGEKPAGDISLIRQGQKRILFKCPQKNDFEKISNRLRLILKGSLRTRPFPQNLLFLYMLPSQHSTIMAAAVSSDDQPLAESLKTQLRNYSQIQTEMDSFQRFLFLLSVAANACFFILVFVPIYFLFHSFGVPILIGLILSMALVFIFIQAFFSPLMNIALLHRFQRHTYSLVDTSKNEKNMTFNLALLEN